MSMSPDPENFETLRRLLVLKRYEQPPPGYFHPFAPQVIARIKAGERAEEPSLFARWFGEVTWLQGLWAALETKPMLAGGVGLAACALLVGGVLYSERGKNTAVEIPQAGGSPFVEFAESNPVVNAPVEQVTPVSFSSMDGLAPSPKQGSLFQAFQKPQAELLLWRPGN